MVRTGQEKKRSKELAPIPKVQDPALKDLRPLMLYEVLRKIWIGTIMDKIRDYWIKWGLINEGQHGFMRGKGTHSAIPIIVNCMETAKEFLYRSIFKLVGYQKGV